MKTIRIGNDISVQWTITRLGEPEIFEGKDISVKLIDKLGNDQVFEYTIEDNIISGTFYGKDQTTNGTYRLLLVENAGDEYMVTLDYIDCFCLSNKMKNQTSNGSDTTSSINTEVIDITSDINLSEDMTQYAKITYVDDQIADVKNYIDSSFYNIEQVYNKQEIDYGFYTKDAVDEIIADLPVFDTYTKEEIDQKVEDVSNNIPTKVSELDNDEGYLVQNDVSTFITEDALEPYAKSEDIPTKVSDLDNDSGYLVANDVSTFITEDALEPYAKTEDIPTKVSELQNDSSYLTPVDVSTMVDESELSEVAFSGDYDDLENKPTIPVVPTNVSAFNNDAGYLVSNDVSTLVDESDLSQVAFSGSYNDLDNTPDLTHFFDDAVYDSSTKKINFKHGNQVVAFIDATDFIKDGMVESVVVEDGYVVITFNTDAGKEEIRIDITDIFNPANYYDKDAIDLMLQGKQDNILDLGQLRLDASNGAIAYGWGNHAEAGYLKPIDVSTFITENDASVFLTAEDVSTFVDEADLAQVAFSGDYNDLENKPTIPEVPTNVSAFTNDAGYLVSNDVSTFLTEDDASIFLTSSDVSTFITEDDASIFLVANDVSTFITDTQAAESFELKGWRGTQAQYDELTVIEQNRLYIILPDSNNNG